MLLQRCDVSRLLKIDKYQNDIKIRDKQRNNKFKVELIDNVCWKMKPILDNF